MPFQAYCRRIVAILVAGSTAAAALPVLAEDGALDLPTFAWMSDSDLKSVFDGKSVEGEYPGGTTFKEQYETGGALAYQDDIRHSGGHWSIQAGSFCTIYDDDPSGGCFRVRKAGKNCYEFFFIARTEDKARDGEKKTPSWTARAWLDTEESTCKQELGV